VPPHRERFALQQRRDRAVVTEVPPDHRLAQEEIFGSAFSMLRARSCDHALVWANTTRFALTGGLFRRTPSHTERCRPQFRVDHLCINRGTTDAIVGRQPLGYFKMSGVGSTAGSPDYLLQFPDARVVIENTMRRGPEVWYASRTSRRM